MFARAIANPRIAAAAAVALTGTSAVYLSSSSVAHTSAAAETKASSSAKSTQLPQLHYFNIPGLAFPIRAALNHANIPFEDVKHEFSDLAKLRGADGSSELLPLGQMPVLVLPNGKVACQSNSILRWAGKQSGLYPTDDLEKALLVDEVMDTTGEFFGKVPQSKDEAERKRLREEFIAKDFAKIMRYFTRRLQQVEGGPFLLGEQLSVADLKLARLIAYIASGALDYFSVDTVKAYPIVWAHYEAVSAHPVYDAQMKRETPPAAGGKP